MPLSTYDYISWFYFERQSPFSLVPSRPETEDQTLYQSNDPPAERCRPPKLHGSAKRPGRLLLCAFLLPWTLHEYILWSERNGVSLQGGSACHI